MASNIQKSIYKLKFCAFEYFILFLNKFLSFPTILYNYLTSLIFLSIAFLQLQYPFHFHCGEYSKLTICRSVGITMQIFL